MTRPLRRSLPGVALVCLLSACAGTAQLASVDLAVNEPLVKGPAVMDVVTPFDNALSCLDGRINKDQLRFSVGPSWTPPARSRSPTAARASLSPRARATSCSRPFSWPAPPW